MFYSKGFSCFQVWLQNQVSVAKHPRTFTSTMSTKSLHDIHFELKKRGQRSGPVDRRSEALRSTSLPRVPLLQPGPELERRAELLSDQAQRPGHRDLHGGGPAPGQDRRRRQGRRLDRPPFRRNSQVAVVGRKRISVDQYILGSRRAQLWWPESLRRGDERGLERRQMYLVSSSCVPRWWVETILVWFKIHKVSLANCNDSNTNIPQYKWAQKCDGASALPCEGFPQPWVRNKNVSNPSGLLKRQSHSTRNKL